MAHSALKEQWEAIGQEHVFADWGKLSDDEQSQLLDHLRRAGDPAALLEAFRSVTADAGDVEEKQQPDEIRPFRNLVIKAQASEEQQQAWLQRGLELISQGRVAVVTMAGGQGTRLGSSQPKGCFNIELPSGKSLFQLQAERLIALQSLAAEASTSDVEVPPISWLVMTSSATDAATREFFQKHQFFGLSSERLRFFQQADMPAFASDGKVLLESRSSLALSPNGNGGVYEALANSGALDYLERAGVVWVHVIGIDNVLVRPADPSFLGFADSQPKSNILNKVIAKTNPKEQVGVMCLRNGEPGVVEYSEIPEEMSARIDPETGVLEFGAANIAEHLFRLEFLRKCSLSQTALLWHQAVKKVPFYDPHQNQLVQPETPNAIKLERFIFDVFRLDPELAAFVVDREEQFSPVKNAEGAASPQTARLDLSKLHRSWILKAAVEGIQWSGEADGLCEIAPAVAIFLKHPLELQKLRQALAAKQLTQSVPLPLYLE